MLWCGTTSSTCVTSAPTASEPHRSERDERTSDMPGSYPAPLEAEARRAFLGHLRDAVALLRGKATPQELDEYRRLIVNLSDKVARAHGEPRLWRGVDSLAPDRERPIDGRAPAERRGQMEHEHTEHVA